MRKFSYTITDPDGIHARPAGELVKTAKKFKSKITIANGAKTADAVKIFAVMSLGAKQGHTIEISAEGDDEDAAAAELETLFRNEF